MTDNNDDPWGQAITESNEVVENNPSDDPWEKQTDNNLTN